MGFNNKLYFVLLLHLLLIDDSVLGAENQATNKLRSRQTLAAPQLQQIVQIQHTQQHASLSKKFRALTGDPQSLRFEKDVISTVKSAYHDLASRWKRSPSQDLGREEENSKEKYLQVSGGKGADMEIDERFPRRRLTMILAISSPSAIAKRGVMISASMKQLQVAYKTMGGALRRGGQKVQQGVVATAKGVNRFLRHTLQLTKRQFRKALALLIISLMNGLHFLHSQLHILAHKKDLLADAPSSMTLTVSATCPSSPPVLSRLSSAPTTTCGAPAATLSSTPTWMSTTSSSQINAPVVTQSTPGTKKAQALSMKELSAVTSRSKQSIDKSLRAVEAPQPSLLGGMLNKLLGGLLILSTGAIVGYFWSTDWRDARLHATSQEFVDANNDVTSINGNVAAVPISPEASRY
ncbi:hypothetical protein IV203_034145 [Nitzschia inconspicua]|uniref:Transmembrane protein n=1 Tax=Nitzschia inconspicua TaxID=303405 RepID=A0A9K3Q7C5_9STRA|nr:hypothetical protein IV203_034145 [Nitzschia inconspicua]